MSFNKIPPVAIIAPIGFLVCVFTMIAASRGISAQWDFGNTVAGIGTMTLAFASVWIALDTQRSHGEQKIADSRLEWNKEIRKEIGSCFYNLYISRNSSDDDEKIEHLRNANQNHAMIKLFLDLKNDNHRALNEAIEWALNNIDKYDQNNLDELSRLVLNETWERAKEGHRS